LTAISPGYEVNDLGFQSWADRMDVTSEFGYDQPTAGQHFRVFSVRAATANTFNFGWEAVASEVGLFMSAQHVSFNSFNARITRRFGTWDDRLTRGGPLMRQPAGYSGSVGFNTDARRVWQFRTALELQDDQGGGWGRSGDVVLGFRFLEIYEIELGANLSRTRAAAQYVTSVAHPGAPHALPQRYVFAPLDQTTVGVETRFNVNFTPNLTLELYAQPFLSSGDYLGLMELAAPRSFDFTRYGEDVGSVTRTDDGELTVDPDGTGANNFQAGRLDFNVRSLLGNAVLRWEWRSGSTLFLVWQQRRSERFLGLPGREDGDQAGRFKLQRDADALFGLKPENIVMLKLTYWLNP
jgi:hypothetical protein